MNDVQLIKYCVRQLVVLRDSQTSASQDKMNNSMEKKWCYGNLRKAHMMLSWWNRNKLLAL